MFVSWLFKKGGFMDIIMIGIGFLVLCAGAFAGSFICTLIVTGYGVAQLSKRILSLENGYKSGLGVQAKADLQTEMEQITLQAGAILKDENIPKDEKTRQLLAIAMQNPKAATKLLKQFGLKDLF